MAWLTDEIDRTDDQVDRLYAQSRTYVMVDPGGGSASCALLRWFGAGAVADRIEKHMGETLNAALSARKPGPDVEGQNMCRKRQTSNAASASGGGKAASGGGKAGGRGGRGRTSGRGVKAAVGWVGWLVSLRASKPNAKSVFGF